VYFGCSYRYQLQTAGNQAPLGKSWPLPAQILDTRTWNLEPVGLNTVRLSIISLYLGSLKSRLQLRDTKTTSELNRILDPGIPLQTAFSVG
jgi:hypothetical protein